MSPLSYRTLVRTRTWRLLIPVIAVFLTVLAGVAVASKPSLLYDALLQRPGAETGTVVVPDRFLREWDPVTVFFPSARGKAGPEDHAEKWVSLTPAHPGQWTWLDAHTLQFRPAEPWPALSRFSLKGEDRVTTLSTLTSPPIRTSPAAGATGLGAIDTLHITFSTRIPVDALADMLRLELSELPGIGEAARQRIERDGFEIKELPRPAADAPAEYAVNLHHPIPLGTRVHVVLRLSIDEDPDASLTTYSFSTATPFRPTAMGCNSGVRFPVSTQGSVFGAEQVLVCRSGSGSVAVEFSARPDEIDPPTLRNLVRFEPAVDDLEAYLQGHRLVIEGDFASETLYAMRLVPTGTLTDPHGRALQLSGESVVHLTFPHQEPFLHWRDGEGLVERFGPKRIPASGRGHSRADLRIYKVDPLNRSLWPFPDSALSVDEQARPPGPGEEAAPWDAPQSLSRSELQQRLRLLGSPAISELVELPLSEDGGAARFGVDISEALTRIDGRNAPGHYLVGLRRLDEGSQRSWVRVQSTDLVLTSVEGIDTVRFQVSSLASGQPIQGASVSIEGRYDDTKDREPARWAAHFTGTTGDDGALDWRPPGEQPHLRRDVQRIVVQKGADLLVLDPKQPLDRFADNHWHGSRGSWLDWVFGPLSGRGEGERIVAHVYTERPIYRPEETVYLRGYARVRKDGRLLAYSEPGQLIVFGPAGEQARMEIKPDAQGNWFTTWPIGDVPTGSYRAELKSKRGTHGSVGFQIEAYKLPTFEVEVEAPRDNPMDKAIAVQLTAAYFAGGRVSGRPVRWRVSQYPLHWTPSGDLPEGFAWSSDGRWSTGSFRSTPSLDRQDTTDDTGQSRLILDPTLEPTAMPRTYLVEATVTGADDQTVTASQHVRAVPAFVVGVKVPRYLPDATSIRPEVLLVDGQGRPVVGKKVSVTLKHRAWHSHLQASDFTTGEARYVTDVVDEVVDEQQIDSASQASRLSLPIPKAGVYVVEVSAADELGRSQLVSVDLYVGGDDAVSWDKPKAGVFSVSADKDSYSPGQTATLVIQSPYQQAEGLVVVEQPLRNRYYPVKIRGGQGRFTLPIEEGWVPRVPVHVILRRGRIATGPAKASTLDLGKPETVASTQWLQIDPVENSLTVTLEHPKAAEPGDTLPVDIRLARPDGTPVSGQVTLWLVDQAVLTLAKEQRLDPLPDLITSRNSRLSIRDTRNLAFGRIPYSRMPGGDGDEELAEGDAPLEKAVIRKNFKAVPYYRHDIAVGRDGRARVEVALPDNLTVFKLRAKATHAASRFGVGKSEVAVRLPVIVQPALPRFVRATDQFTATGIGRIVEGGGGPGVAQIRGEGLTIPAGGTQSIVWEPGAAQPIGWPVQVSSPPFDEDGRPARDHITVTVGVSRTSDGASDAFEAVLPLRDDRDRVHLREIAVLEGTPVTVEGIQEAAREGSVRRTVVVADHEGLVKLGAALDFLRQRPAGSSWERIDRARAFLATRRFKQSLALYYRQDDLDAAVQDTLVWLSTVTDDTTGLVANWPGHTGRVHLTAYAALFLIEAEEAGYPVDRGLKEAWLDRLEQSLRSDYRYHLTYRSWWARTLALQAVVAGGRPGGAWLAELSRIQSGPDGLAQVLLAANRADTELPAIVNRLESDIVVQLYQGRTVYGGLDGLSDAAAPLVLPSEARALGDVTRALGRTRPSSEKLPFAIDALVQLGREDGWGNTNANAAAILALSERLEAEGSGARVRVQHGAADDVLVLDQSAAQQSTTESGPVTLSLQSGDRAVALVLTSYVPAAPGSEAPATQAGLVVSREWQRIGDGPSQKWGLTEPGVELAVTVGNVVEEHVTVVVPSDMHYVDIVVPLAAGMEPLNPRLETAPPEARPSGQDTRSAAWSAYLDDRVVYAYESLPKGTYHFYFRTRATTEGRFTQPPATARKVYEPQVYGASPGARVGVSR